MNEKQEVINIFQRNIADMESHSENNYVNSDERTVCMTVGQIKWLYQYLTKE